MNSLLSIFLQCRSVSTDTRKIAPGSIFFALRGEKFDGHEFVAQALQAGAAWAVIDNPQFSHGEQTLLVPDVLQALQQLARDYRKTWSFPVIGLTGSNGKTTSKELVHAVLATRYTTWATRGNLNNHIGVPLTVLSIPETCEIAVIEMGANHVGEIELLSSISLPTHGFITNIGKAHIGTFGGFENIIRGKTELYQHLQQHQGTVFVNSTNPILAPRAAALSKVVTYPAPGDDYSCELVSADPFVVVRTASGREVRTQLIGAYNFENIAVALCIANYFQVPEPLAVTALEAYVPENMRSQLIKAGTNTLLLDAYNANPSSMTAAIQNLLHMDTPNRVVILGDMYELEEETEAEHRQIGKLLNQQGITGVYLCGRHMRFAAEECPQARYFETFEALRDELHQRPVQHSTLLIKGSRGMGLERVLDVLS